MSQGNEDIAPLLALDLEQHFKQLVLTYWQRLFAFMMRHTGSAQDAEDIVQDAFVRAYYALKDYPRYKVQGLKLQPWLYKITLNVFYNRVRYASPQPVSLDTSVDSPMLELEDRAPGPEEELWRRERQDELEGLVSSLPEHYRVVINLYYFEELSYQEIASLLNQPMGTIKAKLHRGIGLLRSALHEANRDPIG